MPVTPGGTPYTVTAFTTSAGEPAWRAIADARAGAADVPVVVFCHGNPGSDQASADTQFQLSGYAAVRNWLMDNGWGWVEAHGAGANWGNAAGRAAYEAAYVDITKVWNILYSVVIGRSMGALVGAWLASQSTIISPRCAGFVSLSGTADLSNRYASASTGDKANMNAAYGVIDEASWRAAVGPFDPLLADLATWDDRNAIMQWDTSDGTVPYLPNGKAWLDKYGPRLTIARSQSTSGGDHNTTPNDPTQQAATIAFLADVDAPAATDPQRILAMYYVLPNLDLFEIGSVGR